jgi:hypothetical protein
VNDPQLRRDYLGCCALLLGFAGTFFLLQLIPIPLLWYHPLDRQFVLETRPNGLAMDFYGRTLWSAVVGGVCFGLGRQLAGRVIFTRERVWLWLAYGLGMTALAMCLIGYQIWPRPAHPLTIPAWYVP